MSNDRTPNATSKENATARLQRPGGATETGLGQTKRAPRGSGLYAFTFCHPGLRSAYPGLLPGLKILPLLTALLCVLFALAGPCAASALCQDVRVTAATNADVIGVQDPLQLTITVSGKDSGQASAPVLPRLQGFQLAGGPDVSTQFQWINGQTTSSKTFTYSLVPQREGQFTIGPVEVVVGNRSIKTEPVVVRVTASSGRRNARPSPWQDPFEEEMSPSSRIKGDDVFVTAELDRSSAFSGQQVTLSYHLFTQVAVTGLQLQDNPPLTGFWVEDLEVPTNPPAKRTVLDGKEYLEYVVKKQALFPNTAGRLKIAPSTFAISAKMPGDFFGFFAQSQTIYRKTKEIYLEVKPLPTENRPSNFTNAVGTFSLSSALDRSSAATGDAVSLRIKLMGRGNLKMLPDIALPQMPDFTIYSSRRSEDLRPFEADLIGGEKNWEYVIVPKAAGRQTIPAISMSYFDPERRQYETTVASELVLEVTRGTVGDSMSALSSISKQNLTRQGADINFIKLSAGNLKSKQRPVYKEIWFYVLAALPLAANIGLSFYIRERRRVNGDALLLRSRKARRAAVQLLKKAENISRAQPREFYDGAALALSGYLSDRFDLPEIAVTADNLERTLSERSVARELVRETVGCLQECDFGRFVSASTSPETIRQLAGRIRKVIDDLETASG